ncbi:MAG TPA: metal-dependent transcriptional regulator [Chitinispirillaceae bacterium]|nr:metal-dependent transcriptional regulator [Chitinispirillaceae bacterium]
MSNTSLSPTLEDYLEAIYQISLFNKVARSMEIADKLNVKRSSVTIALRSLADKGLINYQARSYVTLTDDGMNAARCVDKKHHILSDFFTNLLSMSEQDADKAACGMEHGMTAEVCKKMTALMKTINSDKSLSEKIKMAISQFEKEIGCKDDCGYKSLTISKVVDDQKDPLYDLNALKPGEHGIIERVLGSGELKKRLREMGVTHGQQILVERAAPLDDPIEIKVRNFHLSLRREEASLIMVKRV